MVVITLSGKAEAGKDTAALMIKGYLEGVKKNVLIIHYADYLKYICSQYFGWDGVKDLKGRSLLQYVGTDLIRAKNPNFWVDVVFNLLQVISNQYDYALIPDTRFPDEIDRIKDGFTVIPVNVVRLNHKSNLTSEQLSHPSETALNNYRFDYTIESESGKDNLLAAVKTFVKGFLI